MLGIFPEIVEMLPATRDERNFVRTIEDVGKRVSIPGEVALSEPCQRGAVLLVDPCQRPRPFDLLEPKIGSSSGAETVGLASMGMMWRPLFLKEPAFDA